MAAAAPNRSGGRFERAGPCTVQGTTRRRVDGRYSGDEEQVVSGGLQASAHSCAPHAPLSRLLALLVRRPHASLLSNLLGPLARTLLAGLFCINKKPLPATARFDQNGGVAFKDWTMCLKNIL